MFTPAIAAGLKIGRRPLKSGNKGRNAAKKRRNEEEEFLRNKYKKDSSRARKRSPGSGLTPLPDYHIGKAPSWNKLTAGAKGRGTSATKPSTKKPRSIRRSKYS